MTNNPDFRLTPVTFAGDTKPDSADVLSLLLVIGQLYEAARCVINSHSATAILMAMAVELQTLLVKLQAMHHRWNVHLPFKEASTVDFTLWSNKAAQMAKDIKGDDCRYCMDVVSDIPSCHCLADLYNLASTPNNDNGEAMPLETETSVQQLLTSRNALQEVLREQRSECVDAITQMVTMQLAAKHNLDLSPLSDVQSIRTVCSALLKELSALLQQMHDQLVKIISSQEYYRLAERILFEAEYDGPTARREAREQVINWRNGVPMKSMDSDRKDQIERVKEEIRNTKHGVKFEQYVDLDKDLPSQRSEFGKFLFHRRREISRSELRQLILLIYTVYYFQQDALRPVGATTPSADNQQDSQQSLTSQKPPLPVDFAQKLRDSAAATMRFYQILTMVEPFVNSGKPEDSTKEQQAHYKDWTWYHLQAAFEELEFLPKGSSKASLAEFIHQVFPHRTKDSVERSLHRNTNVNSPNIVADVVKEFNPVKELWR